MSPIANIKLPTTKQTKPFNRQVAALPFIFVKKDLLICLITSRETNRWIIPKGWPKTDVENYKMAEIEAQEEAGLHGPISKSYLGTYIYKKKLHTFASVMCKVEVYPLLVTKQDITWPEKGQRNIDWFSQEEAANLVEEEQLSQLLLNIKKGKKQTLLLKT